MDQRRKDALKGYREVAYYSTCLLALLIIGVHTENAKSWSKQRESEEPFVDSPSLFFFGNIFQLFTIVRFSLKDLEKEYAKTEEDIKAVQSVGQIVGEVMKQLDTDRCK